MNFLIFAHLFAIAFIAATPAPGHQYASRSDLTDIERHLDAIQKLRDNRAFAFAHSKADVSTKDPGPQAAWRSDLAEIERLLDAIQEVRDRSKAAALALAKADVLTKDTNGILIELLSISDRDLLDRGVIPTSNSAYLHLYNALEGKLNVQTNKLFKFDTILLQGSWQNDPVWQQWDWTKVRAIESTSDAHINIDHPKLPISRLKDLKEIDVPELYDFEVVGPLLNSLPNLESLSLFLDEASDVKELALATCAMKHLKTLIVHPLRVAEFAAEYMNCLPAENDLEKLAFYYNNGANSGGTFTPITTTPEMIEKLHLKQFSCRHCNRLF